LDEDYLSTLHVLRGFSDCPLLPNLVSLCWEDNGNLTPWITSFISRSLTSIVIEVSVDATIVLPPILTKLSTLSPYIRKVRVQINDKGHDDRSSMVEASSQLLMQGNSNRLQQYDVDIPISGAILKHIIQLPSLERFRLVFDSSICQLPDPLPGVVFPSLRVLDVKHNNGDHTWLNLLHAIENPVLSEISVQCLADVVPFMETFQRTMTGCGMHECLRVFKLRSRDGFMITPAIIAYTFPFKNLTTLHVESSCSGNVCQTADLTDYDIDLLTKALPRLESLMLGDVQTCRTLSKITFKSLYTISHRCTRLTTLQIHFDPSAFAKAVVDAESADAVLASLSNFLPSSELCSVTTLGVGKNARWDDGGTIESQFVLALGLAGVFPRLENLEFMNSYPWQEVSRKIGIFRRMGHSGLLQGALK
jgi:hypothetical protein